MTLRYFQTFTAAALIGCLGTASIAQADPFTDSLASTISILDTYNVVTFGDFGSSTSPYGNADSQGPMAIGGNAYINSFNVSPALQSAPYALVTGGDLNLANLAYGGAFGGAAVAGNAFVGGNATLGTTSPADGGATILGNLTVNGNFAGNHGSVTGTVFSSGTTTTNPTYFTTGGSVGQAPATSPVNFSALQAQFNAASQSFAALPNTAGTSVSGSATDGTLTLSGSNNSVNVFSISAAEILDDLINIDVPDGSLAVINLDGTTTFAESGFQCNGVACTNAQFSNILFNDTASSLTMYNIGLPGTLLAPDAAFYGYDGDIEGAIVANSITTSADYNTGGFEFEWDPLTVPVPASLPLFGVGLLALAVMRRTSREF